jgi:DNA-binding GntR family transcriptional regulator
MQMRSVSRNRLRDDIVDELSRLIVDGELSATERLKEIELSERLGVSRTPLREALLILEREGLVISEVNKGFRVAPLSEARVKELFPIIGQLEAMAIRDGGVALRARVGELRAANKRIRSARGRQRYVLDRRFHEMLWERCPNQLLVALLRKLWLEAQRFDGGTERGMADPTASLRAHAAIVDAIGRGDLDAAARTTEEHWRHGVDVVVGWIRPRTKAAVAVLLAIAGGCATQPRGPALDDNIWGYFIDQSKVELLVDRESRAHRPQMIAFEHVAVVTLAHPGVDLDQTVIVADGQIAAIGPSATTSIPSGATIVPGRGRYVMPGLVDMHVHTELSSADYLLDLANGVTTVREMNGYPWMLRQRELARTNALLIPNLFVVGHILASQPLGRYATVVTTPDQARAVVREQVAAGYSAIKVHNMVALDVYDAICDEARALHVDVVGHIPHEITVAHAVACGQRTFEHFKSYIDDRTLTLSHEDYVAATRGAEVWNTPTLYNYRDHIRGDEARAVLARPEFRYVSARLRAAWLALANEPAKPIQLGVLPLEQKIFRDLLPISAHFLAGTDAGGGYPYEVRGFALHDELALMAAQGMSVADVLRTATVEPALAMRDPTAGTVELGKRADLVVLRANPLDAIDSLGAIDGVVVRGIWLPRSALDEILAAIASIANGTPATRAALDAAITNLEQLRSRGVPLRDHMLGWLRYRMEAAHMSTRRPLFDGIAPLPPEDD